MTVIVIAQQTAHLAPLLKAGGAMGWLVLSLGGLLTLWGLYNLFVGGDRLMMLLQTLCSLAPAVLAAAVVFGVYGEFVSIAAAVEPPKPKEFASVISSGLIMGMVGPLATVIPAALGIAALAKVLAGPTDVPDVD